MNPIIFVALLSLLFVDVIFFFNICCRCKLLFILFFCAIELFSRFVTIVFNVVSVNCLLEITWYLSCLYRFLYKLPQLLHVHLRYLVFPQRVISVSNYARTLFTKIWMYFLFSKREFPLFQTSISLFFPLHSNNALNFKWDKKTYQQISRTPTKILI